MKNTTSLLTPTPIWSGGYKALIGCNYRACAIFRISISFLLLLELLLRYRFLHPFYSDEGTLPTHLLLPTVDDLYRIICVHAYSGGMVYMCILLTAQVALAGMMLVGYRTKIVTAASWFLYFSLTLRNTWLSFILDRYFHYMLFYAIFLPTNEMWSLDSKDDNDDETKINTRTKTNLTIANIATLAVKCQVFWIYLDAGQGKYNDPLGGWSLAADPLPALDTYARHTLPAQYMYALLKPIGLRYMTPTVVYAELFACPICLLGSFFGSRRVVLSSIALICSLHVGIAFTVRNTALLSSVACAAWAVFLPPTEEDLIASSESELESIDVKPKMQAAASPKDTVSSTCGVGSKISSCFILPLVLGCIWFETMSGQCNQTMKHIWSTLLLNRWNVFVGAEEYVTWEIAPGRLADGSVVDVWGRKDDVVWQMPGTGAPCTSTARPGRWRSFPYLAGLEGEDSEALWGYLCKQWDNENGVHEGHEGRRLLRYNFFMLQADVLPDMGFSATRKRLMHSHDCTKTFEKREPVDVPNANSSDKNEL